MREIKFRVFMKSRLAVEGEDGAGEKRFPINKMFSNLGLFDFCVGKYGGYIRLKNRDCLCLASDIVDYEIMQYTGLKDKNGEEIYEGDILRYDLSETQHYMGYIKFQDCGFVVKAYYLVEEDFTGKTIWNNEVLEYHTLWDKYNVKIIGNIYENHELLEK